MDICVCDFVAIQETIQKGSCVCEHMRWQRNPVPIEGIFLQHHLKYPDFKRKSFIFSLESLGINYIKFYPSLILKKGKEIDRWKVE